MIDILRTLSNVTRGVKPAEKQNAPPVPAETLSSKLLTAIGAKPEPQFRIRVRLPDGSHEIRLMSAADALAFLNGSGGGWRRLG
jgi:hypothetical protein